MLKNNKEMDLQFLLQLLAPAENERVRIHNSQAMFNESGFLCCHLDGVVMTTLFSDVFFTKQKLTKGVKNERGKKTFSLNSFD